jgi:ligand-binding sensor domain-containing protein/two-component sensor histidine kinase
MRKLVLLLIICYSGFAQEPFNLAFNHLNHEGGLSNNNVFYLHKDSRGYMWLGTLNGLTRFDGTHCKVYKESNSNLRGTAIKNIVEDKAGNLWIGSDEGINFYDRRKDKFTYIPIKGTDEYEAYPYTIDHKGMLWLHIGDQKLFGLYVYNPILNSIKLITKISATNHSLLQKQEFKPVRTYFTAVPNDIGFYKVSIENYKEVKSEAFFDGKNNLPAVNHLGDYLYAENDSTIWVSQNDFGLLKFNPFTRKYKTYFADIKSFTRIVSFKNYLFMGSNEGLYIFDKTKEKFVQNLKYSKAKPNGTSADYAEILYIDKGDNLFISNLGPGLDFTNLDQKILEQWLDSETSTKLGYAQNDIYDIKKGDNEIFVKYQTGPTMALDLNGKMKRIYKDRSPLLVDSQKRQWFYEIDKFIYYDPKIKKETKINLDELKGSYGYELQMVEITPDNFVFSCKKGLFEFNLKDKKVTAFEALSKINTYLIKPLYYDSQSNQIFAVTGFWSNIIVLKKINDNWQVVKEFPSINAYAIRPSQTKGFLWACSRYGLVHINTATFEKTYKNEKTGLPDNFVSDFVEEPNGDHWIVTSKGISHYEAKKRNYRNFTSKDGAYSSEYDWGAAIKLEDGRVVFGGTDGLTVIKPEILTEQKYKPIVQLSNFTVNGKIVSNKGFLGETKAIELEPNQNSFAFNMVGIDYKAPKNIRIFYKLEGYESEWITAENPSDARYTNVPEGDYTFLVKAGFVNEYADIETKKYRIHIKTPIQRTWWFRVLAFATFCGLGYAFYRFRINQLLRLQEVRNRISTDLHDEIGATLSGIGILSAVAKQKVDSKDPVHTLLGRINDDAQTIGNAIDDIVWSVNPKNDELGNVISRMSRNAAELFDAKNIEYKIDTPEIIREIKLSLEQRRDLYLIYKEAVNNLLKYANCTFVTIEMKLNNNIFTLTITDNGVGFDTKIETLRNGLRNMKNRAQKLGGRLEINSEINKGTIIRLQMAIN